MITEKFETIIDFPIAVQIERQPTVHPCPICFFGITVGVEIEIRTVLAVSNVETIAIQVDNQRIIPGVLGTLPVAE